MCKNPAFSYSYELGRVMKNIIIALVSSSANPEKYKLL
jgi:hypothetical protein